MKTINTLVFKLKENKKVKGVYHNEEYIFFIHSIKPSNDPSLKEIETEIAYSEDVDLKVLCIEKNKAYIKDRKGIKKWYTFIDEEGESMLYLTKLKNNVANTNKEHYDIMVSNKDIIENFQLVDITV